MPVTAGVVEEAEVVSTAGSVAAGVAICSTGGPTESVLIWSFGSSGVVVALVDAVSIRSEVVKSFSASVSLRVS